MPLAASCSFSRSFLSLSSASGLPIGRAHLLLQRLDLLLQAAARLRIVPARGARGLLHLLQRRVFAHLLELVLELLGDVGQVLERLAAGHRLSS